MILTVTLFLLTGIIGGFLAGLLGIGGGLVVVPALYFYFGLDPATAPYAMHLALGSSLAFVVINSGFAAFTHARMDGVLWHEVRALAPGLAAGSLLGAALADSLATESLARGFGVFMLAMAALTVFGARLQFRGGGRKWHSLVAGLPMGTVASLVGVGGGVMVVPWLLARGARAASAVASSSMCTVIVAVLGTIGYMLFAESLPVKGAVGHVHWPAVLAIAATAFPTAQIGARLAHRVPQVALRRGFAVLLVLVGLNLIFG